ncbi:MAG TPA: nucleoside triphosphate pyrophosphohydrolase [Tissierellaceae bacterium]|nr:nucleoside triphosphate pyrophosphohydrolase [Tissierellaceae bacterium]
MGKIFVIGLGPGKIDSLTLGAVERINSGERNYLRTEKHPTVDYFKENDIPYKSFDYIYDSEEDFEIVYKKIVDKLINESIEADINYYVPGNPLVSEKTVEILLNKGLDIEIVSGMSFIEPIIELLGRDPIEGLKIVDGTQFNNQLVDINSDIIVTQVYNRRILTDVKIVLSEIYGDDYNVWLIRKAGIVDQEEANRIQVFQLDRILEIDHLTSIYIPKIEENNRKVFDFNDLIGIMKLLRSENGCPWDLEQDHKSIRQCLIEEAYEVVDAIDNNDIDNLIEELGDLLLQVIFHCQIGYDEGEFNLIEVTSVLANKLIYRHPHIFLQKDVDNSKEVVYNWNKLKDSKRGYKDLTDRLKDLPSLPALLKSKKIQDRAADVGFDWDDIQGPIDKVNEEYNELMAARAEFGQGHERVEEELGDLLFAIVNLARFLDVNPEISLNRANKKFIKRIEIMELEAKKMGKYLDVMDLDEMNELWNLAKEKRHL